MMTRFLKTSPMEVLVFLYKVLLLFVCWLEKLVIANNFFQQGTMSEDDLVLYSVDLEGSRSLGSALDTSSQVDRGQRNSRKEHKSRSRESMASIEKPGNKVAM